MDSPWLSANVVQRVNKFLRADACRTKFAHDDSGGSVCEHGGIGERRTGRNRESQNTQNGIPRTRNVKDLPASGAALDSRLPYTRVGHFKTRRRNVQMARRGLFKYAHSFFSARDYHCAAAEVREKRPARFFEGSLISKHSAYQ